MRDLIIGCLLATMGGVLWWTQERTRQLITPLVIAGIVLILLGAFNIITGLETVLHLFKQQSYLAKHVGQIKWYHTLFILSLIFIGSVSYTIAAYYHLKLSDWSFPKAFLIAVPLILIEYQFSIRGNYAAKDILGMNAVQITLITMAFYFINSWVLNYFVLKQKVVWWREVLALLCIGAAFVLTTTQ